MEDLDFLIDKELKQKVENAVEYVYLLLEQVEKDSSNQLFREETYRVIILYIASIIEAILLFLFKEARHSITTLEYKFVQTLSVGYRHSEVEGSRVIVAVQKETKKSEYEIGLAEMIKFYLSKKIITESTAKRIADLNSVRNTHHLSKSRNEIVCDSDYVEKGLGLLAYIIEKAPKVLTLKQK